MDKKVTKALHALLCNENSMSDTKINFFALKLKTSCFMELTSGP